MEPFLRQSLRSAALVANAHRPAIRNRALTVPSFFAAWFTSETPGFGLALNGVRVVRAVRRGDHRSAQGKLALGVQAASMVGLAHLLWQGRNVDYEFEAVFAPYLDTATISSRPRSTRRGSVVPLDVGHRHRTIRRGERYFGDTGWRHTLDVYVPKVAVEPGVKRPALIQIHGGGWILGNKNEQGLMLLNHMAGQGWVGFNANYRLAPKAKFPEQLIDVKRAIAYVRTHADELGADPDFIAVTGGSAGGYLAAMAAMTANDPEFQPGFEDVDTTVQAAVPFYGVYDLLDREHAMAKGFDDFLARVVVGSSPRTDEERWRRFSPVDRVHADAPPTMLLHGTADTLVPVEQGRQFARELSRASDHAVLFAELAGANHAFDVFPSPRSVRTVEWVERFLTAVRDGQIK